jgi:hypothetical protein
LAADSEKFGRLDFPSIPHGAFVPGSDQDAANPSSKQFRLWHVNGASEFVAVVAEAETFEEIRAVRRRPDWRYQATRDGMPVDDETGFPILTLPGQDLTAKE